MLDRFVMSLMTPHFTWHSYASYPQHVWHALTSSYS